MTLINADSRSFYKDHFKAFNISAKLNHSVTTVDQIINQQQIVLKKMDRLMSNVKGFAGFTLIGEGNIVPILDPGQLIGVS